MLALLDIDLLHGPLTVNFGIPLSQGIGPYPKVIGALGDIFQADLFIRPACKGLHPCRGIKGGTSEALFGKNLFISVGIGCLAVGKIQGSFTGAAVLDLNLSGCGSLDLQGIYV